MKKILLYVFLLNTIIGFSQNSFQNLTQQEDQYWNSMPDSLKNKQGSGYKDYQRQKSWLVKRYDENGTFRSYNNSIKALASAKRELKTLSTTPWLYKGPFDIPPNGENEYQSSKGWIWSCLVNPVNHNQMYVGGAHGGVWKTIDGGTSWTPLTDQYPEIGAIPSIQVVWGGGLNGADIVYALSSTGESGLWSYSNGVFKSNDGGITWSSINNGDLASVFPSTFLNNLGRKIIIHPTNNQILYLITYNNIYKTTNGGTTWSIIKADSFSWWEPDYQFGWFDIEIMISGSQEIIFVTGHKIIKSSDGGSNWTDISMNVMGTPTTMTNAGRSEVAVDNNNYSGRAYFFFNNGNQKITKYELSSDTYTSLVNFGSNGIYGACLNKMEIVISPTRSLVQGGVTEPYLYISGLQVYDYNPFRTPVAYKTVSQSYLYGNLNGPGSWVHDDIRCMDVLTESGIDRLFIGHDGGFSTALSNSDCSPGGYFCWSNKSGSQNGLHCSLFYSVSTVDSQDELLMGGLQDCGVFVFNDLSANKWIHSSAGDGSKASLIYPNNNNIMLTADFFNNGLRRSTNKGVSFSSSTTEYTDPNSPIEFRPGNPEIMYLGQGKDPNYNLKRYNSISTNWNYDNITPSGNNSIFSSIGVCESNPEVLYVSNNRTYLWDATLPQNYVNRIWRTANSSGTPPTWVDISSNLLGLSNGYVLDIETNPYNENEIWVSFGIATSTPKVYKGIWNSGMTWTEWNTGLPDRMPVTELLYDKTNYILYATTDVGIYYCKPNVTPCQWYDFSSGLPLNFVNDMDINYTKRKIYAATYGRGIWENTLICNNEGDQTIISTNTTWNEKYLNGNLLITNGATLTINNKLGMSDGLSINIQNGCTLVVNGEISSNCNNNGYWNGNIIVESEGTLILNSSSIIKLGGDGKILIDEAAEHYRGYLEYFSGANIILADANTMIDLKGYLNINDNADFNFTGNGFFRISGNSLNPAEITCGNNASITFNGTGKTDKILEIDQEDMFVPYNLTSFTLSNGWVNMKNSTARLSSTGLSTNISLNNVRFNPLNGTTKTGHRGLWVNGQTNCSIINSDFEYGVYGVHAFLTGGASLTNSNAMNNCNFIGNTYGFWFHDLSVKLSNCSFSSNTYAFWGENSSLDDNLIENCSITNNTYPVQYINCAGDLFVDGSTINISPQTGINATGNHDLYLRCTDITNLSGSMKAGVYLSNGSFLHMTNSSSPTTTHNKITGYFAIRLSNARSFNFDYGANYICPNTVSTNRHIYGYISTGGCPENNMLNRGNQWYTNLNLLNSTHYNVYRSGCSVNTINSNPTATYSVCSGGGGGGSSMIQSNTTELSNIYYQTGVNSLESAYANGNWHAPFNAFAQMFNGNLPANSNANTMLFEDSWEKMRHCLKEMYTLKQIYGTGNSEFAQTIAANNKMRQFQAGNYYRRFQIDLEKATLYRMAGDYNTAISLLTTLTTDTSLINREQAESWLCIVQLEKQITEGTIDRNKIEEARKECPMWNEEVEMKSFEIENNNSPNEENTIGNSWLNVVPNPATESSTLCVNSVSETASEVEITDMFGKLIKVVKVDSGYTETSVSFNDFAEGIYIISLKKDGQTIAVNRVTISKQ